MGKLIDIYNERIKVSMNARICIFMWSIRLDI